jgi:spectinomycin phosphotransferase
MLEKPNIADGSIVQHLRDFYGLNAHGVGFLAAGADVDAAAYRVETDEGTFFIKLRRTVSRHMLSLARFLADERSTQVLAPLPARSGQLATQLGDRAVILYPFIDGLSGFEKTLTEAQWTTLGSALRSVHDAKLPVEVREPVRVEDYASTWRNNVSTHLSSKRQKTDAVARRLAESLDTRRDQIKTIVERAEELASTVRRKSLPEVLCHGDLHGGNVMVAGDGSLAMIDWDDPVMAPRERDLMFIGGGVGGTWNKPLESDAFYRGYGPTVIDAEALAYYRYERIVEDIALTCDRLLQSGEGGKDRALSLRYFMDAFRPNDVVEIADITYASLSKAGQTASGGKPW